MAKKKVIKRKVGKKKKTKKIKRKTSNQGSSKKLQLNEGSGSGVEDQLTEEGAKTETIEKEISFADVCIAIVESLKPTSGEEEMDTRNNAIKSYLYKNVKNHQYMKKYNVVLHYDAGKMIRGDIDKIYKSVTNFKEKKPILLVLYSMGGNIGPAYLIGKLCKEYSVDKFVIVVPRRAKSAATLLCCAGDEIHMGSLSELGPIDPQIGEMPVLGLKNSVEHISKLVKECPESSEMFAKYLSSALPLIYLGHYERVAESAVQYAERLLISHKEKLPTSPDVIANKLVYEYKDHDFVIEKAEAQQIFGEKVVKTNSREYDFGNWIYGILSFMWDLADRRRYEFYFIGSYDSKPIFYKRK